MKNRFEKSIRFINFASVVVKMQSGMIEDIRTDITRLIAAFEGKKAENMILRSELAQARTQNDNYRKQIIELERQIDNLRLTDAFLAASKDNEEAKGKIEKMIKEIDRCIALMER